MAKKPIPPTAIPRTIPSSGHSRGHQPRKPQSGHQPTTSGPPAGKPPSGGSVVKK